MPLMRESALASLLVVLVIETPVTHRQRVVPIPFLLALLPGPSREPDSEVECNQDNREKGAYVFKNKIEPIQVIPPRQRDNTY